MHSNWLKNNILLLTVLTGLAFSLRLVAETEIKGLAELEQLNKPIYLAAVTGEPPSSPESFETNPTPFNMHARYVIDKYSARRNSQLWLNAILVSTSREEIQKMERAVLQFKTIVRNTMYKGDELKFSLDPIKGTQIFLNGEDITTIKEPEFQFALVRYWFGQRIASNRFADKIRIPPKLSALKSYNSLKPDHSNNHRIASIQSMLRGLFVENGSPNENPVKVAKAKPNLNQSKSKPTNTSSSLKKETKANPSIKSRVNKNKPNQSSTKISKQDNKNNKKSTENKKSSAKRKSLANKDNINNTAVKSAKKQRTSVVDQLYKELKDDYIQELIDYIQLNAKPVPSRKIRKKPKGDARIKLSVKFNKERMTASNLSLVDGDFDDSLTESLFKSISNLKKMPHAPEAIKEENFNVEVTLNFNRCKRSTAAWICL